MAADPPFPSIAIVGLGLIGGSVALGIRERWPESRVFGVDTESVLAHALGSGAIERGFDTIAALPDTALIILAAPVRQNIELLHQITESAGSRFNRTLVAESAGSGFSPIIVTDVGGTKRDIVDAARALPSTVMFVGGHPLGGGERGGFAFARPDLFAGRPWIFTPDSDGDSDAMAPLIRLVTSLGATPSMLSADEHDRLMALVSHLPQLTASALMEVVGTGVQTDGLRMAGRGLVDTTRLASSPADVWRDICLTNADSIGDALDCLIERLTQLRGDLRRGDVVEAIFSGAARWRAELMKDNH